MSVMDIQQIVHSFRGAEATAEFLRAMRLGRFCWPREVREFSRYGKRGFIKISQEISQIAIIIVELSVLVPK
jgi:hypothetical protein